VLPRSIAVDPKLWTYSFINEETPFSLSFNQPPGKSDGRADGFFLESSFPLTALFPEFLIS